MLTMSFLTDWVTEPCNYVNKFVHQRQAWLTWLNFTWSSFASTSQQLWDFRASFYFVLMWFHATRNKTKQKFNYSCSNVPIQKQAQERCGCISFGRAGWLLMEWRVVQTHVYYNLSYGKHECLTLQEMSWGNQHYYDLSSGDHECLHNILWRFIL